MAPLPAPHPSADHATPDPACHHTPADVAARIYRSGGVLRIQTLLAARRREEAAQNAMLTNAFAVFRAAVEATWRGDDPAVQTVVDTPAGPMRVSVGALRVLRRHGTVLGRQIRESHDAIARIDREITQLRAALPAADEARSALRVVR